MRRGKKFVMSLLLRTEADIAHMTSHPEQLARPILTPRHQENRNGLLAEPSILCLNEIADQ